MTAFSVVQQNLFELDPIEGADKKSAKPEKGASRDYVFDIMDALCSPILTYSTSWADSMPKRLLDIVSMARLKALMQDTQTATYVDCALYIYTRTYEAPMDSEWADIYTYVCCKVTEEWFKENHWETVGAPRELSEWLQSKLNGLMRHIYEKRRSILKQRLSSEKKAITSSRQSGAASSEQQSMF